MREIPALLTMRLAYREIYQQRLLESDCEALSNSTLELQENRLSHPNLLKFGQ